MEKALIHNKLSVKDSYLRRLRNDIIANKYLYILALPVIAYFIIFHYLPMYGIIIAFKKYSPRKGILGSPWTDNYGFANFIKFCTGPYFWRVLKNTFLISFYDILFGFPAPIIFAILMNEIQSKLFKKTVQTITYMPHFISITVVCSLIVSFTGRDGLINDIIAFFGGTRNNLLSAPEYFRTIYVASGIWQNIGWNSIIYLAALSMIDQEQYESAIIDGAGKLQQIIHITIPGIAPTIIIMLILRMGSILSVGYEKIILLYNPNTYSTSDVISTFIYRNSFAGQQQFSYSAAVGLLNSVVNTLFIIATNAISRRVSETSLW